MEKRGVGHRVRRLAGVAGLVLCAHLGAAEDWVEVVSPHFTVLSNAGEKRARATAREFEEIREVFRAALPRSDSEPDRPIVIYAVRNEDALRELVPIYWEQSGPKPAGVFRRALDKHTIALRTDVRGRNRYQLIYHEYFHLLTNVNIPGLPVWAKEGLAEFWEQTVIRRENVELGNPDWSRLEYLKSGRLLPIEELLGATSNPHQEDPRSVLPFYAQSWMIVHWAMYEMRPNSRRDLFNYFDRVRGGEDSVSAFAAVFGDLEQMESELMRYARDPRKRAMRMKLPVDVDEKAFPARELSEAEWLAAKANFLAFGSSRENALNLSQRALELDPRNAVALESQGFALSGPDGFSESEPWFAKAVAAGSESFFVHFRHALARREQDADAAEVQASLERSVELNPDFAPALGELSRTYAQQERLREAFDSAKRAAALEPRVAWYWVNIGYILLKLEIPAEARNALARARAVAEPHDAERLAGLTRDIERTEAYLAHQQAQRETPALQAKPPEPKREEPEATEKTENVPAEPPVDDGSRTVRGNLHEFRCIASDYFEFVIETDTKTFVLYTTSARGFVLAGGGSRDLHCGRQRLDVEATYSAETTSPLGGEVDGRVLKLDFSP